MFVNDNIVMKGYVSTSYGIDSTFLRPATERSQ